MSVEEVPVRIGLATPIVAQIPGIASSWEEHADAADLLRVAHCADELGFEYLTCSEHVAIPLAERHTRGLTYWDPSVTLAYLAARTSCIRLVTSAVVLGYHHPLAIAKRYGTLDRISQGRVVLGVGVGSLATEFDLLGASWSDRGTLADDAILALRASLSSARPVYRGPHFEFADVALEPCAVQQRVPIWVGGRTRRSLRRAQQLGDGWMPFGLHRTEIATMLGEEGLPDNLEIVLGSAPLDPISAPDRTAQHLRDLKEAGATAITCCVAARSVAHYCEQLEGLACLVPDI